MQADCIIVMDKGEIQQMGTHDQLIQQDGPYKDIYEIQMNSDIRLMEGRCSMRIVEEKEYTQIHRPFPSGKKYFPFFQKKYIESWLC